MNIHCIQQRRTKLFDSSAYAAIRHKISAKRIQHKINLSTGAQPLWTLPALSVS
jgi:hypothetical protein